MHLSSYGLISLKGSVSKPEPGLGFADYQVALANYSASVALKSRLGKQPAPSPAPAKASQAAPAPRQADKVKDEELFKRPAFSAAAALVRKFRS